MNNVCKKQLDRYSMMIVSKYFKNIGDFIKMIQICKKYQEIPEMYHYNPVQLMANTKLFPNIETYHIYDKNEKRIEGYDNYVYWNEVSYDTYLNKNENEHFKNVKFCGPDWNKYKSFKGANILLSLSLSRYGLEEIDLTGITKLEKGCFFSNGDIKHIKLDNRISSIPDNCFSHCGSLAELDLSYIKILGNNCFNYCYSLTALTLPEMFYKIGDNCFNNMGEIKKIETKGVKLIEANMNYSPNKSFKTNGIDVKGDAFFTNYDRKNYRNEIPEGVSIIDIQCFNSITTLGDVVLPKSVTKLDYDCFCFCSIKSIDLSSVVENNCTFTTCSELTSITLNKNIITSHFESRFSFYNHLKELKNIELSDINHIPIVSCYLRKLMNEKGYQYDNCIYTKEDCIETNSIIPDEVNIIGDKVFYLENELTTITIPSNVSHIRPKNFNKMSNLEKIEIQSTNIKCDAKCFNNLQKIKELDLRGITSFGKIKESKLTKNISQRKNKTINFGKILACGNNCICNCSSLTKVIIQNIQLEYGFINCESLKEIEIIGIENNEYEHPIYYKAGLILENSGIHCKRKVFYKYELNCVEESYCIPSGVDEIKEDSFQYSNQLKEVTIPSCVTLINSQSFNNCSKLSHVIIEGNPEIKENAFYGCSLLIKHQPELGQYC